MIFNPNPLLAPTTYRQIICAGDSQTAGMGLTPGVNDYPTVLNTDLLAIDSPEWRVWNVGVGGYTTSDLIANDPTNVDPKLAIRNAFNIVVLWAGTNDLGNGVAPATIYSNLVFECNRLRTVGANFVGVITALSRTHVGDPANYNVERNIFNGIVNNNWQNTFDFLYDAAGDYRIGYDGAENDATYFQGDLIHLTAAGAAIISAGVTQAVPPLVVPTTRPYFTFAAFSSLTTAVAQSIPPGSGALTSSSDLVLGQMAPTPGTVSVLRVQFTGNVANGNQTVIFSVFQSVAGAAPTLVASATTATIATTAGVKTGVIAFAPVSYNAGDSFTVTMTPSAPLTAALTDVMSVIN